MSSSSQFINPRLRNVSKTGNTAPSGKSSALIARINEKKAELDNLKQLRDLSAELTDQMLILEEKLATLNDGTEAVATVLGNWNNVLQAISMASQKISKYHNEEPKSYLSTPELALPQTLVRIPTDHDLLIK